MPEDARIAAFEAVVRAHDGRWWAPESALPAPKADLYDALLVARRPTRRREPEYARLTCLVIDLTLFIPDADLEAARPYLTEGGGIKGSHAPTEEHDRLYALFVGHRVERERLLEAASIQAARRPIAHARWQRAGEQSGWQNAGEPYQPPVSHWPC